MGVASSVLDAGAVGVTVTLLVCLVARELCAAGGSRLQPVARVLGLLVPPLLIVFGVVVVYRLMALLAIPH